MARFLTLMMVLMIGLMATAAFADEGDQPQNQVQLDDPNQNFDPGALEANGGINRHGGVDDYAGVGEPHGDINLDGVGPQGPGPDVIGSGLIVIVGPLF